MNIPYEPSRSVSAKIARKLLPYRARREITFSLNRPIVSFTFDDFPRSAIENGSNVLEAEGWAGTFYVASGLMGLANHHGAHFEAEDITPLTLRGHEIAGHTFTHSDCDQLGTHDTLAEIERNKTALEGMGHIGKIEHFAYPFGAANVGLKHILQSRFKTVRGIVPGVHVDKADLNGLLSTPLFSGPKLQHALEMIAGLKARPGWLTLFTHDIRDNPSAWGCTPDEFLQIVRAVKQSGALVLPIGKALEHLEAHHG